MSLISFCYLEYTLDEQVGMRLMVEDKDRCEEFFI